MNISNHLIPAHSLPVFCADQFRVMEGANLGDPISYAEDLMLDDVYCLRRDSVAQQLCMAVNQDGCYSVTEDSKLGHPGATLHLDCVLTLMSRDGQTTDALVLVETDSEGSIEEIFFLPLAALATGVPYALVGIDPEAASAKLAQLACARFTRGTHITVHSGEQRPIESLRIGDRILTRDDGPQELRWIGESTVRATGDFAPICIKAGTLHNSGDLIVSPDHRLFIYQRQDSLGAGRSELLVKARHLINDDSITVQAGGFVDYFQLLFDAHQIIYAEGIAAESMLIDLRTRSAVPDDVSQMIAPNSDKVSGLDVDETLLDRPDAAETLRRSSRTRS
ncbi:MAG: Hint domain-containing protein [Paracoccaceae bacterium]